MRRFDGTLLYQRKLNRRALTSRRRASKGATPMPYLENHTLYYKKSCPYCQKVLRFMDDRKIMMDTRDTLQPGIQNDLVRVGGKKQVPCLVVNGKPLYESDDIVEYLRTQVPQ